MANDVILCTEFTHGKNCVSTSKSYQLFQPGMFPGGNYPRKFAAGRNFLKKSYFAIRMQEEILRTRCGSWPQISQNCSYADGSAPQTPWKCSLQRSSYNNNNNNNNNSFIFIVDKPQLHNKLPRRTAQIQLNTKNQL